MSPRNEAKTEGLSPHLRNILVTNHLPMLKRQSSLLFIYLLIYLFLNPLFQKRQDPGEFPRLGAWQDVFLPGHVLGLQAFLSGGHRRHKAQAPPTSAAVRSPALPRSITWWMAPILTFWDHPFGPPSSPSLQSTNRPYLLILSMLPTHAQLAVTSRPLYVLLLLSEMIFLLLP